MLSILPVAVVGHGCGLSFAGLPDSNLLRFNYTTSIATYEETHTRLVLVRSSGAIASSAGVCAGRSHNGLAKAYESFGSVFRQHLTTVLLG